MPQQWIQNQWPGSSEHSILISQREQRADAPSFSTLASNFDCETNQWVKNVRIVFGYFAENTLKHPSHSSRQLNTSWTSSPSQRTSHEPIYATFKAYYGA